MPKSSRGSCQGNAKEKMREEDVQYAQQDRQQPRQRAMPFDIGLVEPIVRAINGRDSKLEVSVGEILLTAKIIEGQKIYGDDFKFSYDELAGVLQDLVERGFQPIKELAYKSIEQTSDLEKGWEYYQKLGGDSKMHGLFPMKNVPFDGSRLPVFVSRDDTDHPGHLLRENHGIHAPIPRSLTNMIPWLNTAKALEDEAAAKMTIEQRNLLKEMEAAKEFDSDDDDVFMDGKAYLPGGKKFPFKYAPSKPASFVEEELAPYGYTTTGMPWHPKERLSPRKHMMFSQSGGYQGQHEYLIPDEAARAYNYGPNNNWGNGSSSSSSRSSGGVSVGHYQNYGYPPPLYDQNGFPYNNTVDRVRGPRSYRGVLVAGSSHNNLRSTSYREVEHMGSAMGYGMDVNNMRSGPSSITEYLTDSSMSFVGPGQYQAQGGNNMRSGPSNVTGHPIESSMSFSGPGQYQAQGGNNMRSGPSNVTGYPIESSMSFSGPGQYQTQGGNNIHDALYGPPSARYGPNPASFEHPLSQQQRAHEFQQGYGGVFDRQLTNYHYGPSSRGVPRLDNMMANGPEFQFGGYSNLGENDITPRQPKFPLDLAMRDDSENEVTPKPRKTGVTVPAISSYGQFGNSLRLVNKPIPRLTPNRNPTTTSLRADSPAYIPRSASPLKAVAPSPLSHPPKSGLSETNESVEMSRPKQVQSIGTAPRYPSSTRQVQSIGTAPRYPSREHRAATIVGQRLPSATISLGAFMTSELPSPLPPRISRSRGASLDEI